MFKFFGILFPLLKEILNTFAIHIQVSKQASVALLLFVGFFVVFSTSINNILLEAQINENNKKLSTTPNAHDTSQDNKNTTPTAPQNT